MYECAAGTRGKGSTVCKERDCSTWRVLGRGGKQECDAGLAQKTGSWISIGGRESKSLSLRTAEG